MGGFVPSEGPNLDGANIPGVVGETRMATNAAPVAPAAAATAPIFAVGEQISVRTSVLNERIRVTLNVERDNAGAAGFGVYQITSNGVVKAVARIGPTGQSEQGLTVIDTIIDTLGAAGVYAINAQVTSTNDVETVLAGARLLVQAAQFV